jgi:hypothetical protein
MVAMWDLGFREVVALSYSGLLVSCIVLALSLECCAQIQPATAAPNGPSLSTPSSARQIEVLLRLQFSVPPDYEILFGAKSRSDIAGFDKLPVYICSSGQANQCRLLDFEG